MFLGEITQNVHIMHVIIFDFLLNRLLLCALSLVIIASTIYERFFWRHYTKQATTASSMSQMCTKTCQQVPLRELQAKGKNLIPKGEKQGDCFSGASGSQLVRAITEDSDPINQPYWSEEASPSKFTYKTHEKAV